jgi:hypothetical protein
MTNISRRDVIALGAAAAVPLILPGLVRAGMRQPEKNNRVGIGVIGTGKRAP